MSDLPVSIYGLFLVCVGVVILVAYFYSKEWRFVANKRRGIKLLEEKDFEGALEALLLAERLWMFRLSKQTMVSRVEDSKELSALLDAIGLVMSHRPLNVDLGKYQEAARHIERFFSNEDAVSGSWPELNSRLRMARREFQRSCAAALREYGARPNARGSEN